MKDYSKVTALEYFSKKNLMIREIEMKNDRGGYFVCFRCPITVDENDNRIDCFDFELRHQEDSIKAVMEYKLETDWGNIQKGTKIISSDNMRDWEERCFIKCENGNIFSSKSLCGSCEEKEVENKKYNIEHKGE